MFKHLFIILTVGLSLVLTATAADQAAHAKPRVKPLPALHFKGKLFFPNGTYDTAPVGSTSLDTIDPDFLAAGGNIKILGQIAMPGNGKIAEWYDKGGQPVLYPAFDSIVANPDFKDVALIMQLGWNMVADASEETGRAGFGAKIKPVEGKALELHRQALIEALKKFDHPNVIGYTMDEPENLYIKYYKEWWKAEKKPPFIDCLRQWLAWIPETIRQHAPGKLLMPIMAWGSSYSQVPDLYDVLIADNYPGNPKKNGQYENREFGSPLYWVCYDAARMVEAARHAGGGRSAIFMPACFDINSPNYHVNTLAEQRYVTFAPITRGAMGIISWRLNRSSAKHRKEVVYPVMKEVSELSPFFLGKWYDEKVSSNHDTATAPYLKQFKIEFQDVLPNVADAVETTTITNAVPDVNYCLRQAEDGRWLLLIVNNRQDIVPVDFKVDLAGMPAQMTDCFNGGKVKLDASGAFQIELTPFDVRGYIFKTGE